MNCLHVRLIESNKVRAVRSREFTEHGVIYHLCDHWGKYLGWVTDKECQPLEF